MAKGQGRNRCRTALLWVSIACFVLSSPCVFFGVLGLLGVVADVSVAENRHFGMQFLTIALIPIGVGTVALLIALTLRRST